MESLYEFAYHPDVAAKDLPRISYSQKEKIRKSIEMKLGTQPEYFGEPLRRSLKGYWKLRVGDYRVIYQIKGKTILIFRIGHRREIYER